MQQRLTETIVKRQVCPQNKRSIDLNDGGGLYLRISNNGTKSWRCRKMVQGKTTVVTLGTYPDLSVLEARNRAKSLPVVVKDPEPVVEPQVTSFITVEQIVDEYLSTIEGKRAYDEIKRNLYKDAVAICGKQNASSITKRECVLLVDRVTERGKVQGNRFYAYLKRAFKVAVQRGLLDYSPMESVIKPSPDADVRDNSEKALSFEELQTFLAYHDNSRFHTVLLMILWTGGRPIDVLEMRWRHIQNEIWTLGPKNHKAGYRKPVTIVRPLIPAAMNILERFRGNDEILVFPGKEGKMSSTNSLDHFVRRYRKNYGITGFTPNTLRHTISTRMREIGIRPDIAERIIGHHVDSGIAGVYSSYQWITEMREALELWHYHLTRSSSACLTDW